MGIRDFFESKKQIRDTLTRKKPTTDLPPSKLVQVLSAFDLSLLGIGSTLGVGIYVLAGAVAKTIAGPSVVICFTIAAIASLFAGLCFAEFGAKVPRAGSVYVYCYVTVGELIAFIMGWDLILEYSIGSASVAKGASAYVNSLTGMRMNNFLNETMPIRVPGLSPFPDIFALSIVLLFTVALALGAKESSIVNNICTSINLLVVLFVIIAGSLRADPANWEIPFDKVPKDYGTGGFAPYGITGIFKGAATCFYGFIGFDVIATAGEEVKKPKKSMPIAIIVSLSVIFVAYFGISTVLTMMVPYFEQDPVAPLPYAFESFNRTIEAKLIAFGAVFGLFPSLLCAMYPLTRVVYAMAIDGLIFEFMGRVNARFHTPLYGTIFVGLLTGALAAFLNLDQLVDMMSIGTLMAYSLVAACVILLRYEVTDKVDNEQSSAISGNILRHLWNTRKIRVPSKQSAFIVKLEVTIFCAMAILFSLSFKLLEYNMWSWVIIMFVGIIMITPLLLISRQPSVERYETFTVPLLPWLPGISILINIYLMMQLDAMTWIRFIVWLIIGMIMYFSYGIRHSIEGKRHAKIKPMQNNQPESSNENQISNGTEPEIKKKFWFF